MLFMIFTGICILAVIGFIFYSTTHEPLETELVTATSEDAGPQEAA